MLSIRTFARSAPRAISRMTLRQPAALARPSTLLKPAAAITLNRTSAFSTTIARRAADAENDAELSAKLSSEIQIEEDIKASEQEPSSVKDFLANTVFEIEDTPGNELVKLTRSYNDEKITVSFSIADISNYDPFGRDPALEDEEGFDEEGLQGSGNQSGNRTANPAEEEPLEEEEEDEDLEPAAPVSLSILVEKPGKSAGALSIDATAQNGNIAVENIFYFEDAAIARAETPEAAQRRADIYPGPPFGTLDEDLQVLMERFLEDRGISQSLAVFVPDYVDVKEQREYVRWLNQVKTFVDA